MSARALELVRREGIVGAARRIVERRHRIGQLRRHDPLADLAFIDDHPIVPTSKMSVDLVWFVPPYGRGSGGHTTLFRFIGLLEERGWTSHVCLSGPGHARSADEATLQIREWFPTTKAAVSLGTDGLPECRVAVATGWQTAYPVRNYTGAIRRAYFVQDFEPWFWPAGGTATLAEATYRFGFSTITMGAWLAGELRRRFGSKTYPVGFSYDRAVFFPRASLDAAPIARTAQTGVSGSAMQAERALRVFFYARPVTPRRGFEIGVMALSILHRARPDVTIVAAGWGLGNYRLPFPIEDHGVVAPAELADLLRGSDVALVLSHSNVSLLPLEVMACGVPLLTNDDPWSSWLVGSDVARLAPAEPAALGQALIDLCDDPQERRALAARGAAFAATTDWAAEADRLSGYLGTILAGP